MRTQSSPFTPYTPFARSISHPVGLLTPNYTAQSSAKKEDYGGLIGAAASGIVQEPVEEIGRYLLVGLPCIISWT